MALLQAPYVMLMTGGLAKMTLIVIYVVAKFICMLFCEHPKMFKLTDVRV